MFRLFDNRFLNFLGNVWLFNKIFGFSRRHRSYDDSSSSSSSSLFNGYHDDCSCHSCDHDFTDLDDAHGGYYDPDIDDIDDPMYDGFEADEYDDFDEFVDHDDFDDF